MDVTIESPDVKALAGQTSLPGVGQLAKTAGFRPPRLDYFITTMDAVDKNDSINKKIMDMNLYASSVINIEIKGRPDPSVDPKNTTVIVFYKTKIDNSKHRVDYFYTTVGEIESTDACNKYMAVKNISANDILSVTSTRCKRSMGLVPDITIFVHFKRQPNGAD
jgi:hypothetical protein